MQTLNINLSCIAASGVPLVRDIRMYGRPSPSCPSASGRGAPVPSTRRRTSYSWANRAAGAATPYYAISRMARRSIAVTYVGLAVGLCVLWYLVGDPLNFLPSDFPSKLFGR